MLKKDFKTLFKLELTNAFISITVFKRHRMIAIFDTGEFIVRDMFEEPKANVEEK